MRRVLAAAMLLAFATSAGADEAEPPEWVKALRVRGRLAEEFAYRLHDPGDVSKLKTLGWLEGKYAVSEAVSLRAAVRGWYDAVFDATGRYPANVERDQKTDLSNPKDFREFVLTDFSELRIPIWALDFTYRLSEGVSFEGVWTPDTLANKLPKRGAEFQFARIPYRFRNPVVRLPDDQDEFSVARSEGGFRLSVLRRGWDVSLIYYDEADKSPVFFQRRVAQPPRPDVIVLDPQHPRVHVVGATLGKSFEPVVVRAEAAFTIGKRYETTDPLDLDGVVRRDTLDWLVGVDYTFFERLDTALQLSQKVLMGSATNLTRPGVAARVTTWLALRLTTGFFDNTLNPTLLFVVGANRGDFRLSPRLDYLVSGAVTLSIGADLFEGPRQTLYGQFDRNDRVTFTTTWRF